MSKKVKKYNHFEWIDFENPTDDILLKELNALHLDINLIKDSMQHGHLPKIEQVNEFNFIILRAYTSIKVEKVSSVGQLTNKIAFFIHKNHLITVHRKHFSFLNNMNDAYTCSESLMLDIIAKMLQTYEEPIDLQSQKIDIFEKDIFLKSGNSFSIENLYYLKSKARIAKKVLSLTQVVVNQLEVKHNLQSNLQDIKESLVSHIQQYEEIIESANTILNSYLSITTQKSNDVMKLLTIFSAFFLPLTFIVGIYGMNFKNMPEIEWRYGYYASIVLMSFISLSIYIWFKRKKIL